MKIILFGDSHSAAFTINDDPNSWMSPEETLMKKNQFYSFRTKPFTCFNINNKLDYIKEKLYDIVIENKDYLFFSYGESDIRCHIGFRNNINENIKIVVSNYLQFLLEIKKIYKNVGVYAPIASGLNNGPQGNDRKPSFQNSYERNKITILFNEELKRQCEKNGILFKSIYKQLLNDDNTTRSEYYIDGIHLGNNAFILLEKEFNDLLNQ